MLAIFFDLQEWVPMKKEKKKSASTWDREIEKNLTIWRKKNGGYSTVWSSSTIKKYSISVILNTTLFFLIIKIPGQQYHAGDLLKTRVHWTQVLFRTQFCGTRVLKKW